MANIWEKGISILAGNLNLGHSNLITTVNNQAMSVTNNFNHQTNLTLNKIKKYFKP